MNDLVENFFAAYLSACPASRKDVFSDSVPENMMASTVDKDGWYEWRLIDGTLQVDDYRKVEKQFGAVFPDIFIEWHRRYFFAECDCSIIRLPHSMPKKPLQKVIDNLDWFIAEKLIPKGLIPFADEGNDTGPFVFDIRNAEGKTDFPIRVYDHEYSFDDDDDAEEDLFGLSEVVFSSFAKLLECLTHFLIETKSRKRFDVI